VDRIRREKHFCQLSTPFVSWYALCMPHTNNTIKEDIRKRVPAIPAATPRTRGASAASQHGPGAAATTTMPATVTMSWTPHRAVSAYARGVTAALWETSRGAPRQPAKKIAASSTVITANNANAAAMNAPIGGGTPTHCGRGTRPNQRPPKTASQAACETPVTQAIAGAMSVAVFHVRP